MRLLNKAMVGKLIIFVIFGTFVGCSHKTAEDEMYSSAVQVGNELKDKGYSNIVAFKGGERLVITTVPTLQEMVNKAKCNKDELEKYGYQSFNGFTR